MQKIMRMSSFFKWVALFLLTILPLAEAGYWISDGYGFLSSFFPITPLPSCGGSLIEWSSLSSVQKLLGFLVNLLPLSFSMIALFYVATLFRHFEKLELFDKKNVLILRRVGWVLVWGQIVYPFYTAALSLVLTYRNSVGERNLSVGLGDNQLKVLAIGLSLLLISWIFDQAVKLQEEQEGVV